MADGSFDHDQALTGDDLIDYVNRDLFPYLQSFKGRAERPNNVPLPNSPPKHHDPTSPLRDYRGS